MNLSFTYSLWFLLLILPLAGGLTWLMYRRTQDLLPQTPRVLLSVFRFIVLSILGLLLLEPLLNSLNRVQFAPIIAVLQDDSESLTIQKDSTFIREQYPAELNQFLASFPEEDYAVDFYRFSRTIEPIADADSLSFGETGTNISQAIKDVQRRYQNQNLGAIVLLSDGISTAGINPLYAVEATRQPIYSVLLGDTTEQKDIQIKEVLYNEIAYLNNEMPIRVKVASNGFDQAPLKVTIRNRNKVLQTQNITLGRNRPQGEVSFLIKPDQVGLQRFTVLVSRLDGEISYRNNARSLYVNVLETRVKIALFGGAPHPDIGALEQAFAKDESYELQKFILRANNSFYDNPANYNLQDFDLFILHNFPGSASQNATVEKIVEQIKTNKKPVMYLVGMFADLKAMTPLFDYMAISPKGFSPKSEEIIANFSNKFRDHSTFTFNEDWIGWANTTPPLYRNMSNWEAKPTAEVFATAKIKNIALDYPVFALQNQLGRKNMVLLGENFWRMRAHAFVEYNDFEYFDAWLFNTIKWLMVSDDKRKFKVAPSKRIFTGREPVLFKGQAYDDSYNPLSGVDIKLSLTGPDGNVSDYYLSESDEGQYFLELNNLGEGTYTYQAEGRANNILVGRDRGEFSIGRSNVEHFQLQADRGLMQQLALRTGGEFAYANQLGETADNIKALPGLKPVIEYQKSRTGFFDLWWVMVLLLSLLSVEWIVRKWHSML
ncbi:MAG: hypothetical protein AAGM67_01410 [Bacteroidota bacterium]